MLKLNTCTLYTFVKISLVLTVDKNCLHNLYFQSFRQQLPNKLTKIGSAIPFLNVLTFKNRFFSQTARDRKSGLLSNHFSVFMANLVVLVAKK